MDIESWQAGNGKYLAASMQWLRLRLAQLGAQPERRPEQSSSLMDRFYRREQRREPLYAPANAGFDKQILQAADAREAEARMDPPPALLLLARQLRMTAFEREVLLLCAGMELDTRIPALCGQAMGSPDRSWPSFALALTALDSPSWDALSPQRPLRYWKLIDVQVAHGSSLTSAPLRADERIVNYIKGLNALDERLALVTRSMGKPDSAALPPSQQAKCDSMLARWENAPDTEPPPAAVLLGTHPDAKMLVAARTAASLNRQLYRMGADAIPVAAADADLLARLWQRESALLPLALYVDAQTDGLSTDAALALDRFVSRAVQSESVFFIGSREPLAKLSCESFPVEVERPAVSEQHAEWTASLSSLEEPERLKAANRLASQFSLNTPEIRRIASTTPTAPPETLVERLWDECRDRNRPRLDTLADRIDPRATWNELVVSDDTEHLLREIVAQVSNRNTVYETWGFASRMNRGLGISALFAGESGTGKTMAAEVIANELRLSLYRIDLSQVVSKYIGETEKNLQKVFDLMEGGGSILFFDEADALFGKRSEVKDSHDRYANIEVNYLLQRMEAYTGLAILATNMKSALDSAFVRRLRFIVPFQFPGPAERRTIWKKVFPSGVPVEGLDADRLARLNLTGANIQSVAMNAAFLAARAVSPVTMSLIMASVRTELRKMEKPVSEADLKV